MVKFTPMELDNIVFLDDEEQKSHSVIFPFLKAILLVKMLLKQVNCTSDCNKNLDYWIDLY